MGKKRVIINNLNTIIRANKNYLRILLNVIKGNEYLINIIPSIYLSISCFKLHFSLIFCLFAYHFRLYYFYVINDDTQNFVDIL